MGRVDYPVAWQLQKDLAARRAEDRVSDSLLLLEHPPTYTFGRMGKRNHLLAPPEELQRRGIQVLRVDRGGDVTYHGPGQLVVYPILDLKERAGGIGRYLRDLEEVIIRTLSLLEITGERIPGFTGIWIGEEKIAAIGVRVDVHGITRHGFALNLTTDLDCFARIIPCGLHDKGVTSLDRMPKAKLPPIGEVAHLVSEVFGEVFHARMMPCPAECLHTEAKEAFE